MQQVISNSASKYVSVIQLDNEKKLINFFFYVCWFEEDVNLHTQKFNTYDEALEFSSVKASPLIFLELNLFFNYNGKSINTKEYKLAKNIEYNLIIENEFVSTISYTYYNAIKNKNENIAFKILFDFILFDNQLYESYKFTPMNVWNKTPLILNTVSKKDYLNNLEIKFIHPVQKLFFLLNELQVGKANKLYHHNSNDFFEPLLNYYIINKNDIKCHYNQIEIINIRDLSNYYLKLS